MFRRVLVANRGEVARRVIRACRALNIEPIAIYSEADADAIYLQEANDAVCVGGPLALNSYLNEDAILQAAIKTECQALHPGYGFLAENPRFARRCEQQKLTFIGPKPEHMRTMGDKATARKTMAHLGIPVMPGSSQVLADIEEARAVAKKLGYPVLLKATAGGGGKGMRIVPSESALAEAFSEARLEAEKAFKNPDLYMEKYMEGARHIEFQILGDNYGHVIHLGERECSIQRNHQKLLEEATAFGFDQAMRERIGSQICQALSRIGYQNAGTVEMLLDARGDLYFMEMNTRVQVEHPVTEMVTGLDIVAWQIRIACQERLSLQQGDIQWAGHAIECRINAEDPHANFKPSPGTITRFEPPSHDFGGPIRLETAMRTGSVISPYYDSMIGKLIAVGADRAEAIGRMQKALSEFVIEGVKTTLPLHQAILASPAFQCGGYTCGFLKENPEVLA